MSVVPYEQVSLTDVAFRGLVDRLTSVKELGVQGCSGLTMDGVQRALLNVTWPALKNLQRVRVQGVQGYSPARAAELQQQLSKRRPNIVVL
jgi:hypothetical protein